MSKAQVIKVSGVDEGWVKLLLHVQNSCVGGFQFIFDSSSDARKACQRMQVVLVRRSSWFHLIVFQREHCVYVFKEQYIQKAVIE